MPIQKRTQRTKAFHLYMTTNLQQKEIAEAVGVNRRTVGEWVRNFNWADQKRTTYYSPEQIINQLFEELRVIDQNINRREPELRVATKEENEQRARLSALITAHLKNSGVNWRNTAPEYEYKNDNIIDLSALSALERKNLEKRKKIAEEDANTSYGKRFSEEDLEKYYTKVALQLALADSTRSWEPDDDDDKTESGKQSGSGGDDESGRAENEHDDDEGIWEPL